MGNSNKKPSDFEVVNTFKQNEWVSLQKKQGFQIWENRSRNIIAEVYPLTEALSSDQLEHYEMRNKNAQHIVKVHNVRVGEKNSMCSKPPHEIFIQRIPARLNNISDLTQDQGLYVLKSAYQGFNILNSFYGPIQPEQDLICFNQNGKVKVWATENLSQIKNQISKKQNNSSNLAKNPGNVNKIFTMVENRTLNKSLPQDLKNRFRYSSPTSYFQASNLVDQYLHQSGRRIPQNVARINERYNYRNSSGLQNSSHVQNYNIITPQQVNTNGNKVYSGNQSLINRSQQQQLLYSSQPPQSIVQTQYQPVNQSLIQSQAQSQAQTLYSFMKPVSTINNRVNHIENSFVGASVPQQRPIIYQTPSQVKPIISQNVSAHQNYIPSQIGPLTPQNLQIKQTLPTNYKFEHPGNVLSFQTIKSNPVTQVGRPNVPEEVISPLKAIPLSPAKQNRVNVHQSPVKIVQNRNNGVLLQRPQQQSIIQPQIRSLPNQPVQSVQNNPRQYNAGSFYRPHVNFVGSPTYSSNTINFPHSYVQNQQRIALPPQNIINKPTISVNQVPVQQKQPQVIQQQNQIRSQVQTQPQPQPQPQPQIQSQVQPQIQSQIQLRSQPKPQPQAQTQSQLNSKINEQIKQQQRTQVNQVNQQKTKQQDTQPIITNEQIQSQDNVGLRYHAQRDEADIQIQLFKQSVQKEKKQQNQQIPQRDQRQSNNEHKYQQQDQDQRNYHPFASQQEFEQQFIKRVSTVEVRVDGLQDNKRSVFDIQTPVQPKEYAKQQVKQQAKSVTNNDQQNQQIQQINQDQIFKGYKNQAKINRQPQRIQVSQINIAKRQSKQDKQSKIQQNQQVQQTQQVQQSQNSSQPSRVEQQRQYVNNSSQTPYVSSNTGYQYQYKNRNASSHYENADRIPDNARHQDIQQYIRNKYKSYIGTGNIEAASSNFTYVPTTRNYTSQFESQFRQSSSVTPYNLETQATKPDVGQMATYVQNKYDQFNSSTSYVNKYDYGSQDILFSFKPGQLNIDKRDQQIKFQPLQSYQYMRIQRMEGSPDTQINNVKQTQENKSSEKKQQGDDILDVKNMERSLDKKYSYIKSQQQIKQTNPNDNEQNEFEVKNLEQNLIRFEQSRVGSGPTVNTPQARFETSQVSKIHSIDDRIGVNRRSSMNRDPIISFSSNNFQVKSQYDNGKFNYGSYENDSPRKSGAKLSKVSRQLSSIDQKFSKYVQFGGATNASAAKTALRQKQDNNYGGYENNSSRMATGHFGYADNDNKKGYQNQNTKYSSSNVGGSRAKNNTKLITSDVKGLTYEDLRKFMWS